MVAFMEEQLLGSVALPAHSAPHRVRMVHRKSHAFGFYFLDGARMHKPRFSSSTLSPCVYDWLKLLIAFFFLSYFFSPKTFFLLVNRFRSMDGWMPRWFFRATWKIFSLIHLILLS